MIFKNTKGTGEIEKSKENKNSNEDDDEDMNDMVAPYQKLLNELNAHSTVLTNKRKLEKSRMKMKQKKLKENKESQDENTEDVNDGRGESDSEKESDSELICHKEAYSQEVLCKDNLESEEAIKNGIECLYFIHSLLLYENITVIYKHM